MEIIGAVIDPTSGRTFKMLLLADKYSSVFPGYINDTPSLSDIYV